MLSIARCFNSNPSCLLADEPSGNLDAKNALDILELITDLNQTQHSSLVIVTHDEKLHQRCNVYLF